MTQKKRGRIPMYEGCLAGIRMIRPILSESPYDENEYPCMIVTYEQEKEQMHLVSLEHPLPAFSLDALYECAIEMEEETIEICEGILRERFENRLGEMLVLDVKSGFYKKTLKKENIG